MIPTTGLRRWRARGEGSKAADPKEGGSRSPSPKRGRKAPRGSQGSSALSRPMEVLSGRIERDRGDGTYDIYWRRLRLDAPRVSRPHTDDDGEKETRVLEEYIKAEDAASSDEERKRDDGDRGRGRMRVGDKIEARYRGHTPCRQLNFARERRSTRRVRSTQGRSKYYKGKISRVRADGTHAKCRSQITPVVNEPTARLTWPTTTGRPRRAVEERLIRSLDGGGRYERARGAAARHARGRQDRG